MPVFFLLLALIPICGAETLVVDLRGAGDFTDIQSALNAAADGDTVLVMPGEYQTGPLDALIFNRLHDPKDPTSPPVKDVVLCSAAGPERTILRAPRRDSGLVNIRNGETRKTVLRGFTIMGAAGRYDPGVHCVGSSPVIEDCIITNHHAARMGGGVHCEGGSPILINCVIKENQTYRPYGAGVHAYDCDLTLVNCTIVNNSIEGDGSGSGLRAENSRVSCINCLFAGNSHSSGHTIVGRESVVSLRNCTITGNNDRWCERGPPIAGVSSPIVGLGTQPLRLAGMLFSHSQVELTNCIVWNTGDFVLYNRASSVTISHSCIDMRRTASWRNGLIQWGEGNINSDPLFADPAAGDYRLLPGSPAIDAGADPPPWDTDLNGENRVCWGRIDMGAYEYCGDVAPSPPVVQFRRGDANADGTVDIGDAASVLRYLYALPERQILSCLDAADRDDNGSIDLADAIAILEFLFKLEPQTPYRCPSKELVVSCGLDATDDELGCETYEACKIRPSEQ